MATQTLFYFSFASFLLVMVAMIAVFFRYHYLLTHSPERTRSGDLETAPAEFDAHEGGWAGEDTEIEEDVPVAIRQSPATRHEREVDEDNAEATQRWRSENAGVLTTLRARMQGREPVAKTKTKSKKAKNKLTPSSADLPAEPSEPSGESRQPTLKVKYDSWDEKVESDQDDSPDQSDN